MKNYLIKQPNKLIKCSFVFFLFLCLSVICFASINISNVSPYGNTAYFTNDISYNVPNYYPLLFGISPTNVQTNNYAFFGGFAYTNSYLMLYNLNDFTLNTTISLPAYYYDNNFVYYVLNDKIYYNSIVFGAKNIVYIYNLTGSVVGQFNTTCPLFQVFPDNAKNMYGKDDLLIIKYADCISIINTTTQQEIYNNTNFSSTSGLFISNDYIFLNNSKYDKNILLNTKDLDLSYLGNYNTINGSNGENIYVDNDYFYSSGSNRTYVYDLNNYNLINSNIECSDSNIITDNDFLYCSRQQPDFGTDGFKIYRKIDWSLSNYKISNIACANPIYSPNRIGVYGDNFYHISMCTQTYGVYIKNYTKGQYVNPYFDYFNFSFIDTNSNLNNITLYIDGFERWSINETYNISFEIPMSQFDLFNSYYTWYIKINNDFGYYNTSENPSSYEFFTNFTTIVVGNCFDKIKNQDETDIDYGGICGRCGNYTLYSDDSKFQLLKDSNLYEYPFNSSNCEKSGAILGINNLLILFILLLLIMVLLFITFFIIIPILIFIFTGKFKINWLKLIFAKKKKKKKKNENEE